MPNTSASILAGYLMVSCRALLGALWQIKNLFEDQKTRSSV